MRYDLQHVPAPPQPNTATALLSLYTSTLNIDKNNIAPRLGRGLADSRARRLYERAMACLSGRPLIARITLSGSKTASSSKHLQDAVQPGARQPSKLRANIPECIFHSTGASCGSALRGREHSHGRYSRGHVARASTAVHGMVPDFVNPDAHEGEITIERQLPGRMSVSATYLVTRGLHLPASYDANVAPATNTATYDVLSAATSTGAPTLLTTSVPFYTARIDPSSGLILAQYSNINSWYNGLVLTLRKPMSHDLELLFNYTYSHALDNGQTAGTNGTFFGTDGVLNPYNLNEDYASSDLDQRQRFVGSIVWQPTYAKDVSSTLVRQLADGWIASAIITSATGEPYAANIGTSVITPPNGSGGTLFPVTSDGGLTGAEVSTFASATGGRASWLQRNPYNLPRFTTVDLRLGRGFAIHEKYRFDFSADAFNLFNSTIVQAVNTTAYTYSGPGVGACTGHTNGCLVPSASFASRTTTSGSLSGARQMQINAKFSF